MADDIEYLKKHKIHEDPATLRLPQYGFEEHQPTNEAFGGSGTAEEGIDPGMLKVAVVEVLKDVYDPEIPVNIYDLGLVYNIDISEAGKVDVQMTLTAPACPVAGQLVQEVAERVGGVKGVSTSHVKLTWEPPWTPERMTEEAKLELGIL